MRGESKEACRQKMRKSLTPLPPFPSSSSSSSCDPPPPPSTLSSSLPHPVLSPRFYLNSLGRQPGGRRLKLDLHLRCYDVMVTRDGEKTREGQVGEEERAGKKRRRGGGKERRRGARRTVRRRKEEGEEEGGSSPLSASESCSKSPRKTTHAGMEPRNLR